MYSCSPTLSQISLKNSFGKVIFPILAKIEMMRNKNRLFGRHFETVQHFQLFFAELCFFIAHTYMVQISLQNSGGKVFFYGWVPRNPSPPWAPTGVKVPWSLKVRAFFHKTVRVCHVYCNFKIGFTCRITVIFGTLKDGSLLINTLASKICFSYRNMFQNGIDALPKIVDAFLSKSSKFNLVRIIR